MNHQDFADPPKSYSQAPFWTWNDRITEEEIIRQIAEMDDQGWGGFFIWHHDGLEIPYLSPELMACCRTAVLEAKKRGMAVWIIDEHIGPSGYAGGLVPSRGPEYRMKLLVCRPHSRPMGIKECIKCFAARTKGGEMVSIEDISGLEQYHGESDTFLHFYEWTDPLGNFSVVHGGSSYVDLLDPKVVAAFVEITYEAYYRALGDEFGKTVQGLSTEMPAYTMPFFNRYVPRPSIPWTASFPSYFVERNGYNLLDYLPSLFYDVGDYRKVRCDYWRAVSDRFLETFVQRLSRWCNQHKVPFVGHYWGEECLHWIIHWAGPIMPLLAHHSLPFSTQICRNIEDPMGVKLVATVGAQFGRERVAVGAHEMGGDSLTFEDRKSIGNWLYVLGGNLLSPNRACYSLRGMRKHRNPPSVFYQQPYWPYEHLVSDYFRRLSYALTQGKQIVDILVLLPTASMWSLFRPMHSAARGVKPPEFLLDGTDFRGLEFSQSFSDICDKLLRLHWDYHFGDEKILTGEGRCADGLLWVGQAGYRVVLVPPSITWSESTIKLLRQFIMAGGKVIAVKPLPQFIDCHPAEEVLPDGVITTESTKSTLDEALGRVLPKDVDIDAENIWYHHRRDGELDIYFLANVSNEKECEAEVKVSGEGALEEWDPATAEICVLPSISSGGYTQVTLQFPPAGSHLLVLRKDKVARRPVLAETRRVTEVLPLAHTWRCERRSPNALVLDYCQLRVEDKPWRTRMPVFKNDRLIQELGAGVHFAARFEFHLMDPLNGAVIFLALDDPERFGIRVNGQGVEALGEDWWIDRAFKRIDIAGLVRTGENVIDLVGLARDKNTMYTANETQLESIYVCGDFSVMENGEQFELRREGNKVQSGDLVKQGYPFFAGRMAISQEVEVTRTSGRWFLQLDGLKAVVADICINGRSAGQVAWQPYRVELTELLHVGRNHIEIQLINTLFNLLGPHHNPHHNPVDGVTRLVTAESYTDAMGWKENYTLVPFGLDAATLVCEE